MVGRHSFQPSIFWVNPAHGSISHYGKFWKCQDHPQQQLQPLRQIPPHSYPPVSLPCVPPSINSGPVTAKMTLIAAVLCWLFSHMVERGIIVGTSLSKYLLEKSRLVFQVRTWISGLRWCHTHVCIHTCEAANIIGSKPRQDIAFFQCRWSFPVCSMYRKGQKAMLHNK